MTASVIEETVARFTADPTAGQAQPAVTAVLEEGRASLSAGAFTWQTDLPPALGGGNEAPTPTAYLLGALAGCVVVFIRDTLAPQLGVPIDNVSAVARCSSDAAGLVGIDGANPRLTNLTVDISVESPAPEQDVERLRQTWLDRCPIYLALVDPTAVEVNWT